MARLQFCDYHNMVAILEKSEHNFDFHPIVDSVEVSPLRRNLKIQDKEGISSLPDAELFENLTLMGYNISPNQKFTFQKVLKDREGVTAKQSGDDAPIKGRSNEGEATAERISNDSKEIARVLTSMDAATVLAGGIDVPTGSGSIPTASPPATVISTGSEVPQGEGSSTPIEPHHTPSPKAQQTSSTSPSSPTLPSVTTAPIPTITPFDTPTLRSRQGNIAKSSTLPHDSTPRVTSHAANEGSMQLKLDELTGLCTSLQRKHSEMVAKFESQELEINRSNLDEEKAAAERVSDDSEEMATVLTSMDAATVLASGVAEVPTGSGSIPTAGPLATEVPTGSDVVPTTGPIFATATVVTPYTRRKGKETMVESKTPKKRKIARDAEVARIHAKEELQMMINSLERSNEIESAKKLKTSEEVLEEVKTSNENPKEKEQEVKNVEEQLAERRNHAESVEEENVVQREEEEVEDISQVQDIVLCEKLLSITRLISNIESLNDNSTPDQELLNDDSILSHESFDSNFEDNPSISRPPPKSPNDNFDLEPEVISAVIEDIDEPDEHFNPGGEIFVSTNNKDVDYFPFMFVIQIFLPYLILLEISPLFLTTESEDTVFDPGLSLDG
nr:hypothetical protein [Tanacetum cinerariifolium]